jgi:hypothetical protein
MFIGQSGLSWSDSAQEPVDSAKLHPALSTEAEGKLNGRIARKNKQAYAESVLMCT